MITIARASYEDRLNRLTAYIYDHLDGDLSLDTLAGVAALSPYHWHRTYHAIRGETISATVKRLRLQRAGADLAHTARPVSEVATRAGYGSVSAFNRAFAETYGLPPASYRETGSHTEFKPGRLEAPRATWRVEVKELPALTLLTIPHRGSYMEIGRAFETLFTCAGTQSLIPSEPRMIGIYHDDPTLIAEAELRSAAGLVAGKGARPAAPIALVEVPARTYAVLRHQGPYADMRAAYVWLFGTWLPQSGHDAAAAPLLEEYLNNPRDTPPAQLLTDLCLPLQ